MKKQVSVLIFTLFLIASISMISAVNTLVCATTETTFIAGTITDQTNANTPINGANVVVTCDGNVKNTISDINGGYSVEYTIDECDSGDSVMVSASYSSLNGNSNNVDWFTDNSTIGCLKIIINVGVANVPLVPEFGFFVGGLTLVSAIGIFFFVRRN